MVIGPFLTEPPPVRVPDPSAVTVGNSARALHRPRARACAPGGFGGFQILVGDVDLRFKFIQHRVFINRPPDAAIDRVVRLGRFPFAGFLIGSRRLDLRRRVIGSDFAAGQQQRRDECKKF